MNSPSLYGPYKLGLSISQRGVLLSGKFTLTVTASNDVLNYPLYPEEGSVRVDKQGVTALGEFGNTGVAQIELSATGIPTSNGVDLIVVMDLSGSMRYGLDNTSRVDQENYAATRLYAMEQSLKQMVTMLRESGADVRIAMSDFGDLDSHEFEGAIIDYSIREQPFFDVDFSNAYRRSNDHTKDFYEFSNYLNFPMKDGKLINPLYCRDDGQYFSFAESNWPKGWNGEDPNYPYFYTYMDDLGYDLDWQYLVDIAKANGMPSFDYDAFLSNKMLPELTKLLKEGKLVNPYYSIDQYYPTPTEDQIGEDFFTTMGNMGYDISWDQFAKIAYRNRAYNSDGTNPAGSGYGEIGNLLMTLLDGIRAVPGDGYYTLSPYAYFYNPDGLNWWAEAIKGKTTELYPVIICGKYFYYNTNKYVDETNTGAVKIDLTGDGVGDYNLPAETFLWIIGVIGETEMVLEYQVYLTGSIEGEREKGTYDTNTHAELQYINYLGNNCKQEVPTPKYPWKQDTVGYAFYLVDSEGIPSSIRIPAPPAPLIWLSKLQTSSIRISC